MERLPPPSLSSVRLLGLQHDEYPQQVVPLRRGTYQYVGVMGAGTGLNALSSRGFVSRSREVFLDSSLLCAVHTSYPRVAI